MFRSKHIAHFTLRASTSSGTVSKAYIIITSVSCEIDLFVPQQAAFLYKN